MRLFVALALPEDLRARLADLGLGVPGARWIPPENLHLTLRFIGEADGHQAQDIDAALSQVHAPGFSVTLAGLDQFGGGDKVRSLWVGVESNEYLARLHAKIETAFQRIGLPPERRKFKPHVTLARFKSNPRGKLLEFLARNSPFRSEPFEVSEFILYSSFLSHNGAIHAPEAAYPLTRPA